MKHLILTVVTGWQEKDGAQALCVKRPYARVGVGECADGFKWDESPICGVWGCGTSLQAPEFRSISASPAKMFLSVPLFLLYQSFTVVDNGSLGELKPQGLSEGREANGGDLANSHLVPGLLPWI